MTAYRVEIDGEVVWTDQTDTGEDIHRFPAEYLNRPAEPAPDTPFPAAHHLFVDDLLIGVQISQAEEDALVAAEKAAQASKGA